MSVGRSFSSRIFLASVSLAILVLFMFGLFSREVFAQEISSIQLANALKIIAAHGDMEDVPFVARSLGLELKPVEVDTVGQNYTIAGADTPFDIYYRIGPKRLEIGNRRSVMFSINIDRKRYCLKISDAYSVFGPPLPDIPVHIRYGSKEEELRAEQNKEHHRYALSYEFVGETNVLSVYFTFAYHECANNISIAQNQNAWRLPSPKADAPAPAPAN